MPLTYECPLRWADMDLMGHVNNVTYLDYVAEARYAALGSALDVASPVRSHHVAFVSPLVFRPEPVLVDTWAAPDEHGRPCLQHEVYDEQPGSGRTVHLRVSTLLAEELTPAVEALAAEHGGAPHEWRPLAGGPARQGADSAVTVRHSDLDRHGHARDVKLTEYFQEARVRWFSTLRTDEDAWSAHVVARTDVESLAPVTLRAEPYLVHSWVAHVGTSSFTASSVLRDGDDVLARASVVMVAFDRETQRPRPMVEGQRQRLLEELDATTSVSV